MFYILNRNLEKVAEITSYYNLIWNPMFLDKTGGSFECQLPYNDYSYIMKDYIIYNDEDRLFGIISNIKIEEIYNEEMRKTIIISGNMGASLLNYRVIYPLIVRSGKCHKVLDELVSEYITNSLIPNRNISNLSFQPDDTFDYNVNISTEGTTLSEVFESLLSKGKGGYKIELNIEDKSFILKMYKGKDISDNFIFCKQDNNLQDFTYQTSNTNQYTTCIVSGDNDICSVIDYDEKKGIYRKEIFLDKSSLKNDKTNDDAYRNNLRQEGYNELLKYQVTEGLEFNIIDDLYKYCEDYQLGDIVTVRNYELKIESKLIILSVLINYDENGNKETTLTLGDISEIELEYKEQEENTLEDANESGNTSCEDVTTNVSSSSSVSRNYIPVYCENHKDIIGGIFNIDNNQYLLQLNCNVSGQDSIGNIYYEADEDLLSLEKELHINSSTTILCPGSKVGKKYLYHVNGNLNYFSYSKIITRDKTPEYDPGCVIYDIGKFNYDVTFNRNFSFSGSDRYSYKTTDDGYLQNGYYPYRKGETVGIDNFSEHSGRTLVYEYSGKSLTFYLKYNLYDNDTNYRNYIDSIVNGGNNFKLIGSNVGNLYYRINGGKLKKYETDDIITLTKFDYLNIYTDNLTTVYEVKVVKTNDSLNMNNIVFDPVHDMEQTGTLKIIENKAPLPLSKLQEMTCSEFATWMGGFTQTIIINVEDKKSDDIFDIDYI